MSHSKLKRLRYEEEEEENDNVSINSSMDNTAIGDAKDAKMAALESKNALLEAKNEILEGKLENHKLRAKIGELIEEIAALKQTKNGEQMAQIENNQKIDDFMKQQQKEIAELKAKTQELAEAQQRVQLEKNEVMSKLQKEISALKAKNQEDTKKAFGKQIIKEVEEKTEMKIKEVMAQQQKENAEMKAKNQEEDMKAFEKKLKEAAEKTEVKIKECRVHIQKLAEEIPNLNQQLLDQMKPEQLWNNLIKAKRIEKTGKANRWNGANATATISRTGLQLSNTTNGWLHAVAVEPFGISAAGRNCRKDFFPGTLIYYYEVIPSVSSSSSSSATAAANCTYWIGLSHGFIPGDFNFGKYPNSYAINNGCDSCTLSGKEYHIKRPSGSIKLERDGHGDVIGCGLLLSSKGKLAIFFTANGTLLSKQIPISLSVDRLYPTVFIWNVSLEANFGDDQAKPFKYDIDKCPGLEFE